jgi:hypothetical protein
MNKRQVIILWVIAIVLGVSVATMKTLQNRSIQSATKRAPGQTLFESFPATDAAAIQILGAGQSVSLARKEGKWTVAERDGYPAHTTHVNDLIRTLGELKVTMGMEAGPSFAPRFGMDENATTAEDRGLTAIFKDASDKEIAKVSFGKTIENASAPASPFMGGGSAVGRYLRNHADDSGFYAVSEMFPSLSADAKYWLADGFLNIEKIKSISVTEGDQSEPLWKLTRESEEAEFTLVGATGGEVLDSTATAPLKSLFAYARFDDVVPAADVAARSSDQGKRTATIETVEGFTYTVTLTPAKPATESADGQEPSSEVYLLTATVDAELPAERNKEADEKPEDASAKDAAFTERKKALSEKLSKEKALAGISFEVGKSLVEPLLKARSELITQATPAAEPEPAAAVQQLPGGMIARPPVTATTQPIQAVTPPIGIPSDDELDAQGEGGADADTSVD